MSLVPDLVIAILAAWLGAVIFTRTPHEYVSRVFAWLALLMTSYGVVRAVGALTRVAGIKAGTARMENGISALLPAVLLHIVLALIGARRPAQRGALLGAYLLSGLASLSFLLPRGRRISVRAMERTIAGVPEPVLAWAWLGFRAVILGLAVWSAWDAWRAARPGSTRRAQLSTIVAAVIAGAVGGITMILSAQLGGPEWPGITLVAISLVLVAYAVIAKRVFLAPEVAQQSFLFSLGTGFATTIYVGLLVGLERLSRDVLGLDVPLVTVLAVVLTVALFDPIREQIRGFLDRRATRREVAYRRLLRAFGDELLPSQRPEAAIGPLLEELCRTLNVRAAAVVSPTGDVLAAFGPDPPAQAFAPLILPLRAAGTELGYLRVGPKSSTLLYTERETGLLGEAATYMAAALRLAERQAAEATVLEAIHQERAVVQTQELALTEAFEQAETPRPAGGPLHVFALGPLRVERDGEPIRKWGGVKAGTRQAEAVFAFLFDRGERGVGKDEFIEVIWPETPIGKADLAFHRTLGGLRRMLEPDLKRGSEATTITYHNDRYRLNPATVAWSDVAAFGEQIALVGAAATNATAIAALEQARALYRGDYLHDCPFFGDSPYVEERRTLLRGRSIDVLLALGERYEAQGDRAAAAACFREALQTAGDDCPRADDGLARLGLPL